MGNDYKNIHIIPVVMMTDWNLIQIRNSKRTGRARVPDKDLKAMYNRFTTPARDPFNYTAIMYVDKDGKMI